MWKDAVGGEGGQLSSEEAEKGERGACLTLLAPRASECVVPTQAMTLTMHHHTRIADPDGGFNISLRGVCCHIDSFLRLSFALRPYWPCRYLSCAARTTSVYPASRR